MHGYTLRTSNCTSPVVEDSLATTHWVLLASRRFWSCTLTFLPATISGMTHAKSAVGFGNTVIMFWMVLVRMEAIAWRPHGKCVMSYEPGRMNVCSDGIIEKEPSPKFHRKLISRSSPCNSKATSTPSQASRTDALKGKSLNKTSRRRGLPLSTPWPWVPRKSPLPSLRFVCFLGLFDFSRSGQGRFLAILLCQGRFRVNIQHVADKSCSLVHKFQRRVALNDVHLECRFQMPNQFLIHHVLHHWLDKPHAQTSRHHSRGHGPPVDTAQARRSIPRATLLGHFASNDPQFGRTSGSKSRKDSCN